MEKNVYTNQKHIAMDSKYKAILLIITIILVCHGHNGIQEVGFTICNMWLKHRHKAMHDVIYSMKHTSIDIHNVPAVLRDKIFIFNINIRGGYNNGNVNKKWLYKKIFSGLAHHNRDRGHGRGRHRRYVTHNINVVDYLDYKTKYYFSPHTDVEWNVIANDGYQIWVLLRNENRHNHGNMFIVYNDFLYNKYTDVFYYLFVRDGKIHVAKNCSDSVITHSKNVLEVFDVEWFMKNTQVFYLDLDPGDVLVFNKNICHMSDVRGDRMRHAINFRVVVNDLKLVKNNSCYKIVQPVDSIESIDTIDSM